MTITNEQKERVKILLDEVYEMLEHTDNYISFEAKDNGIRIVAMRGPFDPDKHFEITAFSDWTKIDDAWTLDTMRTLMRLETETRKEGIGATKQETGTTDEQ